MKKTLQQVFSDHFTPGDVEEAKRWMQKWYNDDLQIVVGYEEQCSINVRTMAGYVSEYLEGYTGESPGPFSLGDKIYLDTKYGAELYFYAFKPLQKQPN